MIYAGTTMGLFKSPNMGATWKLLTKEQVNAIIFDPATARQHVHGDGI